MKTVISKTLLNTLAVLVAAIALFSWNAISWMVFPFHGQQLRTLPDDVMESIKTQSSDLTSGVYHYPGLDDPHIAKKSMEGPRIPLMVYKAEGTAIFNPFDFIKSLFFNLVSAGLLFVVLTKIASKTTKNVLIVSAVMGLLIGFMADLPKTSWHHFPTSYAMVFMVDYVIGFLLAGWVLSKISIENRT